MSTVEKISITLPSEMISAIRTRVEAGSYASTSEVVEGETVWITNVLAGGGDYETILRDRR